MEIKKILVPVMGHLRRSRPLEAAALLSKTLHAHIETLYVKPDLTEALRYATGREPTAWMDERMDAFTQEVETMAAGAHTAFVGWAKRHGITLEEFMKSPRPGPTCAWRHFTGTPLAAVARLGRFCDLIVLERPSPPAAVQTDVVCAALFGASRPVFLVPPEPPHELGSAGLVGWNGSQEAMRAMTSALPLLARMQRVVVLTIGAPEGDDPGDDRELLDYLACHGVVAERMRMAADGRPAGERLLHEAAAIGAGLLVMGGFTHSRFREAVLGGATRYVLQAAALPVLLSH
ncbi:MAG TPA: universal stress protein [Stellaceae bacterium]|nr:universal stress protein [Stellaceae bacterium]